MTHEQFAALVADLEEEVRRNPKAYQFKVLLLALLGNAYLATVLVLVAAAVIAAGIVSIVVLKGLIFKLIGGAFLYMILRAMWVKVLPPTGLTFQTACPVNWASHIGHTLALGAINSSQFGHVPSSEDIPADVSTEDAKFPPRGCILDW